MSAGVGVLQRVVVNVRVPVQRLGVARVGDEGVGLGYSRQSNCAILSLISRTSSSLFSRPRLIRKPGQRV